METWRWILVVATGLGFAVTVGGLVAAFVAARREYDAAQKRIETFDALSLAVKEEDARLGSDVLHAMSTKEKAARRARWDAEFEKHDLVRVTVSNMPKTAMYESKRLLGLVLKATRRDFLIAAFGLLVSTAASIGSLFLAN